MPVPDPDIHVDEAVVRSLIEGQCPDLSSLTLRRVASGFDNSLWRIGDDLVGRFPRREVAVALLVNELRWLPLLSERLPLAVPRPVRVGRATPDFPYPWSIARWIDGTPACETVLTRPESTASLLAGFMSALHTDAPPGAPHNPLRSVPLGSRTAAFEERIVALGADVGDPGLRAIWDRALDAPQWERAPTWIHGDLHPMNLLVEGGELVAALDFGDLCAGDPATDVACAWMLLPPDAVGSFLGAYENADPSLEARALGWATLFGLMFREIGLEGPASYAKVGARTLESVLAYASAA